MEPMTILNKTLEVSTETQSINYAPIYLFIFLVILGALVCLFDYAMVSKK